MSTMNGGTDRITEVRIRGMRALADIRLSLNGITVLIGENGSGKSTIIEALEILRRVSAPMDLVSDQLDHFHGGLDALLRAGETTLGLGVSIQGGGPPLEYDVALTGRGGTTIVAKEWLLVGPDPSTLEWQRAIWRDGATCTFFDAAQGQPVPLPIDPGWLALTAGLRARGSAALPALDRVARALGAGTVHLPFNLRPAWFEGQAAPMRLPAKLAVANALERSGSNLANCFHRLSNGPTREAWERTLRRVRLGLGEDVVNVRTPAVGPSQIELVVDFRGLPRPVAASSLSDGQLAYLALVAMAEIHGDRSFLALDEPETHLHPDLLVRAVWLLEEMAESCPVILATHSDRLLDALTEPAESVVLCEIDEARATTLKRPDPEALERWLKRYRGLGELRAQGYAPHVFRDREERPS
ncbi:MAG: AAA family ATPase [Byssovorax sp.]